MKKIIMIFLMISTAAFMFAKSGSKDNSQAYSFESTDLDGNKITSDIYSNNKITMINIWGTFCGPCIREMPELAQLSEEYKSKGVEIIGIPIDIINEWGKLDAPAKSDALKIIDQTGVKYKNVVPTIEMFQTFLRGVQAVPTTIFIDKNGKLLGTSYLGSRSKKDWQKIIDKLLESQK